MEYRKVEEIIVGERMRKLISKEKLLELEESLKTFGFINPISITADGRLIAGFRRLRAAAEIYESGCSIPGCPAGMVPVSVFSTTELRAKELELEENIRRHDMTWKEVARSTAELHRLRQAENPDWRPLDTAKEIGLTKTDAVHRRLILAEYLDNPKVAGAPSESAAFKILKKELETEFRAIQAVRGESELPEGIVIECMDAEVGIKTMVPKGSVDLILTDPPYGIGADKLHFRGAYPHGYADTWEEAALAIARAMREATAACKDEAHCYIFGDITRFSFLSELMDSLGWEVWPRPLIWAKTTGTAPDANHGPLYSYEAILYAYRGGREVVQSKLDVIHVPIPQDKDHPAQKPLELIKDLMSRSVRPGNVVLDPFCGSAVVAKAALEMHCRAYCFDIDPKVVALARGSF